MTSRDSVERTLTDAGFHPSAYQGNERRAGFNVIEHRRRLYVYAYPGESAPLSDEGNAMAAEMLADYEPVLTEAGFTFERGTDTDALGRAPLLIITGREGER